MDFIGNNYEVFKSLHIIFVISWMAGMFYLPRLFVYHTEVRIGTEEDKRFQIMEKRLIRIIINPTMILTMIFGLLLSIAYGISNLGVWFHIKIGLVLILSAYHGLLSLWRKDFERGANKHSAKFYRIINEIPFVIMAIIVFLVVMKPLD